MHLYIGIAVDYNILYDHKWRKLLRRSFLFKYFPFADFVLTAGSMALGDVHQDSDFDVIIGARYGRLYTARFFCLATYKLLKWRKNQNSDGMCFNHFVTEKSYRLQPPYNLYWQELYKNLVPVYGNINKIQEFFIANASWVGIDPRTIIIMENDLRFRYPASLPNKLEAVRDFAQPKVELRNKFNFIKIFLEKLLSGKIGDWLEKVFKKYQIFKIKKNLKKFPPGYKPRIIYNDEEVELHLDTKRLETIKNKRY